MQSTELLMDNDERMQYVLILYTTLGAPSCEIDLLAHPCLSCNKARSTAVLILSKHNVRLALVRTYFAIGDKCIKPKTAHFGSYTMQTGRLCEKSNSS